MEIDIEKAMTPAEPPEKAEGPTGRGGTFYRKITQAFLDSGHGTVKLDHVALGKPVATVNVVIRNFISSHQLPIRVNMRGGEIYLTRTDLIK